MTAIHALEWALFAGTLIGIALLHRRALHVALAGLVAIVLCKLATDGFASAAGVVGLGGHLAGEWVMLANLFGLLVGFTLLGRHFEDSGLPALLPRVLPADWRGGFALLIGVFLLSGFLDNIAAALIGGATAHAAFRSRVHVGYVAAIIAAANAGGAGSVLGDTTSTMLWLGGIAPASIVPAYGGAAVAFVACAIPASISQHRYQPLQRDMMPVGAVDWCRVAIVAALLVATLGTNIAVNAALPRAATTFPWLGTALWVTLLATASLRRPDWTVLPRAAGSAVFLVALVFAASMMPVASLPPASPRSVFGLGVLSAVFDNIPLTELALKRGGYDWGLLAYAVGFGGSMVWFGSSAGVALSGLFPECRSTRQWLRHAWVVAAGYASGFIVAIWLFGWRPSA